MPTRPAAQKYTDPALRDRIKKKVLTGSKGGRSGQWSARKAQLVTATYEKEGGGFVGGRDQSQKHLQSWTKENWTTRDGKPAQRGSTTARYLPKQAWSKLSKEEQSATDQKKRAGSRTGKQFVPNTPKAKAARRSATQKKGRPPKRSPRSKAI